MKVLSVKRITFTYLSRSLGGMLCVVV